MLQQDRSRCQSIWENLDRGQYRFKPIKFLNLVDSSSFETRSYNIYVIPVSKSLSRFRLRVQCAGLDGFVV